MIKEENKRNIEMIKKTLGSIFMEKLQDPNVIEIMCNSDGSLWIDELGVGMSKVGSINPYNVRYTSLNHELRGAPCLALSFY